MPVPTCLASRRKPPPASARPKKPRRVTKEDEEKFAHMKLITILFVIFNMPRAFVKKWLKPKHDE